MRRAWNMLDYIDNIVIGCAALVVSALLFESHSSMAYTVTGAAAYFLVAGFAGFSAGRGTLQIVDYGQSSGHAVIIGTEVFAELVEQGLARNARGFVAKRLVLREHELLAAFGNMFGACSGSVMALEELERVTQLLAKRRMIYARGMSVSRKDFGYDDEVARFAYDSAMLGLGFLLGRTKHEILVSNALVPYCSLGNAWAKSVMHAGPFSIAVPSRYVERAFLHRANSSGRDSARLLLHIVSSTMKVIVCS